MQITVDAAGRSVLGQATFRLTNTSGVAQTLPLLLNSGYRMDSAQVNGVAVKATREGNE